MKIRALGGPISGPCDWSSKAHEVPQSLGGRLWVSLRRSIYAQSITCTLVNQHRRGSWRPPYTVEPICKGKRGRHGHASCQLPKIHPVLFTPCLPLEAHNRNRQEQAYVWPVFNGKPSLLPTISFRHAYPNGCPATPYRRSSGCMALWECPLMVESASSIPYSRRAPASCGHRAGRVRLPSVQSLCTTSTTA